jgi:hypothetical protein
MVVEPRRFPHGFYPGVFWHLADAGRGVELTKMDFRI